MTAKQGIQKIMSAKCEIFMNWSKNILGICQKNEKREMTAKYEILHTYMYNLKQY